MKRRTILTHFLLFVLSLFSTNLFSRDYDVQEISRFEINGAISPATFDYLSTQLKKTPEQSLILIKINTPGGLVTTTKEIISLLSEQNKPVVIWITPSGASAASAGAIIASSADFIFMDAGTSMGAATPVGLGEDIKESDGKSKIMNDLLALVRAQSQMKNRPYGPFEQMVSKAESYTPKEALDLKIIDGIVSTQAQIIEVLNEKTFVLKDGVRNLKMNPNLEVKDYEHNVGQAILNILANPSTAYFLFLIGAALIYFELQAPGGFIAGSIGSIFLILAGIAFQVLPLNWGAFGLIILGIILLVLEIYIVSYGILGVAGGLSILGGSLFLFDTELSYITINYTLILSCFFGVMGGIGTVLYFLSKEKKKDIHSEKLFLDLNTTGIVLNTPQLSRPYFQIKVRGEIWRAMSDDVFEIGETVKLVDLDTRTLTIKIAKHF